MNLLKRSIHDHNVHSPLTSAPGDLLIEIATHLESRSELLSLCFTVGLLHSPILRVLIRTLVHPRLFQRCLSSIWICPAQLCRAM